MNEKTMTRQKAEYRLMQIQAQMFVLGEEAKQLVGFLNLVKEEDKEKLGTTEETISFKE